jgi:hypothetical protein
MTRSKEQASTQVKSRIPEPAVRGRGRVRLSVVVAVTGGATRYELPSPVTFPDGSATMLLLLDKEVPGESSFLFAPDPGVPDSASHPFRVARFTNQTGGLLERGPLAFFGEGGFLGQGVIDNLPQGASGHGCAAHEVAAARPAMPAPTTASAPSYEAAVRRPRPCRSSPCSWRRTRRAGGQPRRETPAGSGSCAVRPIPPAPPR